MKKRISVLFAAILTITLLCSCGAASGGHDVYSKIFKMYNSLSSFTAEGTMVVVSNLTESEYPFRQYYAAPDKYRTDFADMICIYADGSIYLKSAAGAQAIENYAAADRNYIFVTEFFREYFGSELAASAAYGGDEDGYTLLSVTCGGANAYRAEQRLWIDNSTLLPYKLETYDADKNPVLTIEFERFTPNDTIDAEIFSTD